MIGIRTVGIDNRVMLEGVSQNKYSTTNPGQECSALLGGYGVRLREVTPDLDLTQGSLLFEFLEVSCGR